MIILKKLHGFNFIELIVALIIVIITAVMAIPSIIDTLQRHRLTTVAENFYYAMQYARSEAMKRNTTVYVSFQTGDNWCYGINTGATCTCTVASGCNLGAMQASKTQDISLSLGGSITGNAINFEATRGAANTTDFITLTTYNASTSMGIKVSTTGNIQLCSANVSGYQPCT